jgi:hypothetical protein
MDVPKSPINAHAIISTEGRGYYGGRGGTPATQLQFGNRGTTFAADFRQTHRHPVILVGL